MEKRTKRIIIGCVTIVIIILMIIYVDFQNLIINLQSISFFGIFLFSATYTVAFIFRALKLKVTFNAINLNPRYLTIYGAIGTGWAINELTPAKLGDIAKMEYIHQRESNFRLSKCLVAVLIDRFIDLIILFSITCFTLLYIYLMNISYPSELNLFIIVGALILLLGALALLLLFFKTEGVLNFIGKISLRLKTFLEKFIYRFVEGLNDFRKDKKRMVLVLVYNIPTWFFESLTLVIIFYLAGYDVDFFIIILAQIITFFTKTIPITPGGWGFSEIIGTAIITLFYPIYLPINNEILSLFVLDHFLRIFYVFIYGGISTVAINFKFKEVSVDQIARNSNS
ncbi:MAG: lysylphosphatidylglycerol synthase transmembrane domain-containing protein [Candidatus Thorarchaeota archaeon]